MEENVAESHPRDDDRNDEVDDAPAPIRRPASRTAEDVPSAD